MSKRSKNSLEDKLEIVMKVNSGDESVLTLSKKLGLSTSDIYKWVHFYNKYGVDGLMPRKKNTRYSLETQITAVNEYLNGEGSYDEIVIKYNISSRSVLMRWVEAYKNGRLKVRARSSSQKKHRKQNTKRFNLEEKIEIVRYYHEYNNDYHLTADKFGASYQQVYSWVKKFDEGGIDALEDKRGQKKGKPLTEEEKLKQRIKEQEIKMRRLEAENAFLKKLEELEGKEEIK
ncbi:helix-turn-helix domain-containing protein [Pseudalkalibacillus sp. A8]|uniref:helix-turn-helix domain-containing protein n=1 Tax=Pseudalkalibacillus sp. A8 TaxID=3382641 RepID=UPI0038B4EAE7